MALELTRARRRRSGRVAVLSAVEMGLTYRLRRESDGMVKPVKERAECLRYYHYFLHRDLGLCYVRLQSWFPFAVRVGLNGHEWLRRQLEQRGVKSRRRDNLLRPHTLGELLRPLGRPVIRHGRRRARALNLLAGNDGELLRTLAHGNFLLRRFRNADLRIALYGQASNAAERRRQSRAVTRRLALLRTHGLIVKVTRSHR